jgi:hypothetical protein
METEEWNNKILIVLTIYKTTTEIEIANSEWENSLGFLQKSYRQMITKKMISH